MKTRLIVLTALAACTLTATAKAHVSVTSGPAIANQSQEVTFGIGHGCAASTLDTYQMRIEIPTGVTNVRAMSSDFGPATLNKDVSGVVTSVSWQKSAPLLPADTNFYKLTLRFKVPDAPFTQLYFKAHQVCLDATSTPVMVEWVGTPAVPAAEPAAALTIVPKRLPGWNKYTVAEHITDPSVFFADAQIVWRGTAAYSFNTVIAMLIAMTPGVSAVTDGFHPNNEIWVKY